MAERRVLAIDTSTPTQSVALLCPGRSPSRRHQRQGRGHGGELLVTIAALLEEAALRPGDLDLLVYGAGPGSFTGLRVGLACLKGLAFANGTPLLPLSSLEGMAWGARGRGGLLVPLIDARKRELYAAAWRVTPTGDLTQLAPDQCLAPDALPALIAGLRQPDEPVTVFGEGALAWRDALAAALPDGALDTDEALLAPDALALAARALALPAPAIPPLASLEPNYQRLSEAEALFGR
jgi:tRNA threonylcarbamoyladenosine biosynthesis protein TsaB